MTALQTTTRTARALTRRVAQSRQVDFWMRELSPAWSLTTVRARVVDVFAETHDVSTFVLAPNALWPGHRAGQFVHVEVDVDGVKMHRCYSLSSAPGDPRLTITVKRVPGGRVSSWLHDHVRCGDVLGLSMPSGEFVAPEADRLLLLSGGSGVTPVMSILRDLARRRGLDDVVFLHAARSERDIAFEAELSALAAANEGLRLAFFRDNENPASGRLDAAKLRALVPDFEERLTMLCGPAPMMDSLSSLWVDSDLSHRLKTERFAPARSLEILPDSVHTPVRLTLVRSGRVVTTNLAGSLLEQLESEGERPESGCRMGICNTCACRKQTGIVENMVTGEISTEPNETIRLCVSRAKTNVELAL